jgi:hypothetical protein
VTNEREFGPGVDLDLLADYIGGALDGTPEEAAVERRIAEDPAWAQAHAETSAAVEAVRVDLSALGAVHERMPPEVVGRLEAALAPVPPGENGNVVELAPRRARGGRWAKRLAPVAVAAGVLISVALGASLLRGSGSDSGASTTSAGDRAAAPAAQSPQFSSGTAVPPAAGSAPNAIQGGGESPLARKGAAAAVPIVTSGTDYTRDTLSRVASRTATDTQSGPGASGTEADADAVAPAELSRLKNPGVLRTCLAKIRSVAEEPEAAVRLVDLARFEGSPAVVVLFTDRIWVSGQNCGLTGPDTVFTTHT